MAKDLCKNTEGLWGARLSAAIVLDSKELLAGETVMIVMIVMIVMTQ